MAHATIFCNAVTCQGCCLKRRCLKLPRGGQCNHSNPLRRLQILPLQDLWAQSLLLGLSGQLKLLCRQDELLQHLAGAAPGARPNSAPAGKQACEPTDLQFHMPLSLPLRPCMHAHSGPPMGLRAWLSKRTLPPAPG